MDDFIVYRACSTEEYNNLINDGFVEPLNHDFISFSTNYNIALQFASKQSDLIIHYNKLELLNQGGIEIEYTPKFFKQYPELAMHCDSGGEYEQLGKYLLNTVEAYDDIVDWNNVSTEQQMLIAEQQMLIAEQQIEIMREEDLHELYVNISKRYTNEREFVLPLLYWNDKLILDIEKVY